jgi:hypothetical protein
MGGSWDLGVADIFIILLVTIGPLKATLVDATLTKAQMPPYHRNPLRWPSG